MTYEQSLNFLSGLANYEKTPLPVSNPANYDLRRMADLLHSLGHPQLGKKAIHIAGTKGKGSTCAMIAGILIAAGYRTGLFTSPHLFTWQERISFNSRQITKKDFAGLVTALKPYILDINQRHCHGSLTVFEVLTAMAFSYFNLKQAEVQVLEVGLGGRLDSTNVVGADICIITSISFDHTEVLGKTLKEIASEKAGIIKPCSTVISAPQLPEAASVIEQKCSELGVQLILAGRDLTWKRIGGDFYGQDFSLSSKQANYHLSIPLLGDFQLENAALAIATIEQLNVKGFQIDNRAIRKGLKKLKWPARLQIMGTRPLFIVDGAHNVYSIHRLLESIKNYFRFNRAIVIFGASSDKDITGMAEELGLFASHIILTASGHARSAGVQYLTETFHKAGIETLRADNPPQALANALALATEDDLILATGSLFLAAEIQTRYAEAKDLGYV